MAKLGGSGFDHTMSALGQKRTYAVHKGMSALPPKADMCGAHGHVRCGPIADMAKQSCAPTGAKEVLG
jgi:hypothetical protein